jgi:hypothetical protein
MSARFDESWTPHDEERYQHDCWLEALAQEDVEDFDPDVHTVTPKIVHVDVVGHEGWYLSDARGLHPLDESDLASRSSIAALLEAQ